MRSLLLSFSAMLLLLTSACAASGPAVSATPVPSATVTSIPPTETPLPYDPDIYFELFSYEAEYGSLAAVFEDYEAKGYCTNPFQEGYPRRVDGNWVFLMKDPGEGNLIFHDILLGEQVVQFTISTSNWATALPQFNHHYRIITHRGALISLDMQGSFADCEMNEENVLIRDFLYSPTTDEFVFRKTPPGKPIGFIAPLLVNTYGDFEVSEYITPEDICERMSKPGQDYIAYRLPGGDGTVFTWGKQSLCMYLTADRVE